MKQINIKNALLDYHREQLPDANQEHQEIQILGKKTADKNIPPVLYLMLLKLHIRICYMTNKTSLSGVTLCL